MAKFTARLTAPSKTNKYYYSNNNAFYRSGYGMPNCTAYAHGRFAEITGKFPAIYGNAEDWWDAAIKAGFKTGQVPKLGAIIVWKAGQTHNSSDGAGHVAIVEQIRSNGDIVTSNSAWQGTEFYVKVLTKASGYLYSNERPLLGFIYCGIEFEEEPQPQPSKDIVAGMVVTLSNTKCYASESVKDPYGVKSGAYYLWDATVKNGRIRITNTAARVGVAGQVTCWIAIADVGLVEKKTTTTTTSINAGTKCVLSNVPVYSSESGSSIGNRSGIYYTWDSTIKNGRIRMTNSATRVGVLGQVSFWIDAKNAK